MVDKICDYECGRMTTEEEIVNFFQELIDKDMARTLQGHYGRTAAHLISTGACHVKEETS